MRVKWLALLVIAGALSAGLLVQTQQQSVLRSGLISLRQTNRELKQLQAENLRLIAYRISEEELKALRSDWAEAAQLRREIDQLKKSLAQQEETKKASMAKGSPTKDGESAVAVTEGLVPAARLKNAGLQTPAAAVETALWSAVGGDIDVLGRTLVVDPMVRARIDEIIAGLPAGERSKFVTAERFIAFMTAQDIPVGEVRLIEPRSEEESFSYIGVQIRTESGSSRIVAIPLRREGSEWRLVVPPTVVEKYAAKLKGENLRDGK